jgi:preprotein translocase subunit SecG
MTMPNDPTAPVPVPPPPGGEPTMPVTPSADVPTVAAQPGYGAGAGAGGGSGAGSGGHGDDGFDLSRVWWILLIILVIGILIGVLIALLSGGDDGKKGSTTRRSTTTSSSTSTSTSSTSSTTSTTTASGPQVQQFTVNQNPVSCPNASATVNVTLVWSTQNTSNVTIAIDNPNGPYGTYQPTGQQQVPFTCSVVPIKHTYYLIANGANNQKVQKSIVVNGSVAPSSTSSSTTSMTGP